MPALLATGHLPALAPTGAGIGTKAADPSAALDVVSSAPELPGRARAHGLPERVRRLPKRRYTHREVACENRPAGVETRPFASRRSRISLRDKYNRQLPEQNIQDLRTLRFFSPSGVLELQVKVF